MEKNSRKRGKTPPQKQAKSVKVSVEEPEVKKGQPVVCLCCRKRPSQVKWACYVPHRKGEEPSGDKCLRCSAVWSSCFAWMPWQQFAALVQSEAGANFQLATTRTKTYSECSSSNPCMSEGPSAWLGKPFSKTCNFRTGAGFWGLRESACVCKRLGFHSSAGFLGGGAVFG